MTEPEQLLRENLSRQMSAITLCLDHQLPLQAMQLIFCGIDAFAWITAAAGKEDTDRSEFLRWVDCYLPSEARGGCTALDLYAARCGILHTLTSQSKLFREGKARQVAYGHGAANSDWLRAALKELGASVPVLHIQDLAAALQIGAERCCGEIFGDAEIAGRAVPRIAKLFAYLPVTD